MTQKIMVSPSGFNVSVLDTDDVTGAHHRHVLAPGTYVNGGAWVPTALAAETQAVQAACNAAWTSEVIAAYQAAFPYIPPPAPDIPTTPSLSSVARLAVSDASVSGVDLSANIAAAIYLDVGSYMLFFNASEPDTNYLVRGFLNGFVTATDQETDYFIVQCTDHTGTAFDPATLQIETLRVQ